MLRPVAGAAAVVVLAAACDGLSAGEPSPSTGPGQTASPSGPPAPGTPAALPAPTATPTTEAPTAAPSPTATLDEREVELERLRATDFFVEFAEADRARHATWARFAYDHFAPHADQQVLFEWANKDELWNSIAPLVRDECLLAGRPATRPMWDAQIVIPAGLNPSWNNDSTGGRGYFVDFVCAYQAEDGSLAELWTGALIRESDQHGVLTALSPPLHVPESEHVDLGSAHASSRRQLWDWVMSEPVEEEK